jgi:valyl-tRNA synthetase
MLHPFMPFVTEELWNANARPYELIVARWPAPQAQADQQAKAEIEWLIELVSEIRSARTELNVPPSAKPMMEVYFQSSAVEKYLARNEQAVGRMARVELIYPDVGRANPTWDRVQTKRAKSGAILMEREGFGANISLEGLIDVASERSRLAKAAEAAEKERDGLAGRLSNPNFTERAKPEAVEKARADHAEKSADAERYRAALERLGS